MEKNQNLNHSETKSLTDLINYQEQAVVSRTLIKKPTGTVTVFAFDKDQGLSEHSAPFDALVQVIDGYAEILINKVSHKVLAGQMILMPANIPHAVKASEPFKMMLTMIKA